MLLRYPHATQHQRNQMQFTLQQAATATGKAKSTLQRAIKAGKLSASRNSDGSYCIDSSELLRVYPLHAPGSAPPAMKQLATPERNDETDLLRLKIELLQIQLEQAKETTNDLRKRLDDSDAERRQLLNLLQHQSNATAATNETGTTKSWFSHIFK